MNRNYKVIWNRSLGCFTAVAEYAKSRGKSSSGAVTSNATPTSSVVGGAKWLRLSSLCLGLAAAGFSLQAIAVAPATDAFYVGVNSAPNGTNYNGESATGINAMTIGRNATAAGSQAIAIGSGYSGQSTTASGEQSIAIGANVESSGNSSIAIGGDDLEEASKNGVNAIFHGYTGKNLIENPAASYDGHTQSSGAASVAIGVKARSDGELSTAVGVRSSSTGAASSAFGMGASASKKGSLALGAGSIASEEGSVALGSFSKTDAVVSTTGITLNGSSYVFSGTSPTSTVSVGGGLKDGVMVTRTITNVAAGRISGASTDAINGSQLHATNLAIAANKTHFYSVKADPVKGLITSRGNYNNDAATGLDAMAAGIEAKAAGKEATAIGTNTNALGNFSTALGTQANAIEAYSIALGAESTASGRLSTALGFQASASANNSMALGSKAEATAVKSIALGEGAKANHEGSVALGNFSVTRDVTLTTAYKPFADSNIAAPTAKSEVSVGSTGKERRITNLAAGAENTDAVNVSQLKALQTGLTNTGFNITADNYDLSNSETEDTVKLGETVAYTSEDGNIITTVKDNKIDFGLGDELTVGTSSIDGKDGFIGVKGKDGMSSVAINGANGTIGLTGPTGVSGTIGVIAGVPGVNGINGITRIVIDDIQVATMKDGLNFEGNKGGIIAKELNETLTVKGNLANGSDASGANLRVDVANGNMNLVMAKKLTDIDSITINNDGPIITKNGIVMGRMINGKFVNKITNLAPGVSPGDAVNKSQLDAAKTHYYSVNDNGTAKANYANNGATGVGSMAAGIAATAGGTFATAIGTEANAQGYASTALGLKAQAIGVNSTALGREANATGDYSTALGWEASASADNSMALGRKAEAAGANNIALGREANTAGRNSTALGLKASASANNSMALGTEAEATAAKSIALGEGANAAHEGSIALGASSVTDAAVATSDITLLGTKYDFAGIKPKSTVSVGSVGKERTITNVAAGRISSTSTDAINGSQLHATNLAIGDLSDSVVANKTHYYSVNDGGVQQDNYDNDGAIGNNSLAAGVKATATANRAVAMGNEASATGSESTALGSAAQAFADSATAVGFGARADQYGTTAMGTNSRAQGMYSTAVGTEAEATGYRAVAMGKGAIANDDNSVAMGAGSVTTAAVGTAGIMLNGSTYNFAGAVPKGTVSVGSVGKERTITNVAAGRISDISTDAINGSQLNATNLALGEITTTVGLGLDFAGNDGTVITKKMGDQLDIVGTLNASKKASAKNIRTVENDGKLEIQLADDLDVTSVTTGNTSMNNKGISILGGTLGNGNPVRLTKDGLFNGGNTIKGVGAGRVDATSNQAINGSQLFGTTTSIKNAIGGETVVNGDGTITTTNIGNTGKDNIHDAIESVRQEATDSRTTVSAGNSNITVTPTGPANGPTNYEVTIAEDLDITSVKTGNTVTNNDGVKVDDGAGNSTTITTSGTTVTNAAGNTSSYGANGFIASDNAGNSTIVDQSGISFTNSAGATGPSITAGGINAGNKVITGVANGTQDDHAVNYGQLKGVKESAENANKGWNVSAQGANTSTVKPSDTVNLENTDNNITVSKTADSNNVTFNLSKDIVVDSVKTGDSIINNDGLTIADGPKFTKTEIDAGGNKITNVANGFIEVASKDAVNGGQLFEVFALVQTQTVAIADMGAEMDAGLNFGADTGAAINKKLGDSALNFKGGNNITTTAVGSSIEFDLNGEISLDKVITGNTSMSNSGVAIIGGPNQSVILNNEGLNNGGNKITNVADGMAPRDAVNYGQLDAVNRNLGNSINELGYKIGEVEDDANAGISAAMAMSSLPQSNIAGRSMIGGGIASYNGESAVAIGMSRVSDNGRWVIKVNGTADTQGNAGGAIGAGFHF